tara:strand:- start:146 stop:388 length:243 start_codon:yes stop_codon:yes gene_type:complete
MASELKIEIGSRTRVRTTTALAVVGSGGWMGSFFGGVEQVIGAAAWLFLSASEWIFFCGGVADASSNRFIRRALFAHRLK